MLIFRFLAVLAGDLGQFNEVVMSYKEKFINEKTYTLIIRWALSFYILRPAHARR